MIDIEIMQDASEIIHYDSNKLPYAIQERLLSQFTGHKALCHWHPDIECIPTPSLYCNKDSSYRHPSI